MRSQLLRISLGAALVCAPATLVAQKFEGAITIALTTPQGTNEMTYLIKGDQVRIDLPGRGGMSGYMLRDNSKKLNAMVIPSQSMWMDMQAMPGTNPTAAAKTPDIKSTGRKETIAGYECQHVVIAAEDGQYDVCAAAGLGSFVMGQPMGGRARTGGALLGLER